METATSIKQCLQENVQVEMKLEHTHWISTRAKKNVPMILLVHLSNIGQVTVNVNYQRVVPKQNLLLPILSGHFTSTLASRARGRSLPLTFDPSQTLP